MALLTNDTVAYLFLTAAADNVLVFSFFSCGKLFAERIKVLFYQTIRGLGLEHGTRPTRQEAN